MENQTFATGVEARNAMAARLYPEPAAKPTDPAPNAEVAAVRAADTARVLYRCEDQMGDHPAKLALALNPEGNQAQLEQSSVQLATMAQDIGFTRDDLDSLAVFASQTMKKPLTEDEQRVHKLTAITELRAKYGDRYDDAIAGAGALAKRDPRFAALLVKHQLASNPWLIGRLAEIAQSPRYRASGK